MDWEIVSAISSCFSTIITCTAFVVAFLTYKKQYSVKLKFDVSDEPGLIAFIGSNQQDYGFNIKIRNVSNQPITIESISLGVLPGDTYISNIHRNSIRLEAADIVSETIPVPKEVVLRKLWANDRTLNPAKRKVCFQVMSTFGTHIVKTKTTLRDLLELRYHHPDAEAICNTPDEIKELSNLASLYVQNN